MTGLLLAVLLLAPASADAIQSGARAQLIAEALKEDPVYVSDSMARVATPERIAKVRAAVERWDEPIYVIWAPALDDEPGVDVAGDLLTQVADRLGRDGAYFLQDEGPFDEQLVIGRVDTGGDISRAGLVASDDVPYWEGAGAQLAYTIEYARTGERPRRGEGEAYRNRDETAMRKALVVMGGTTLVSWVGLTSVWAVRRRRGDRLQPQGRGRRGAASGPPPGEQARTAVARLAERLDRHDDPPPEAVDALAAAQHVLGRRRVREIDEVGALVLARHGEEALQGRPHRRACFFDPLHGWTEQTVRFALGGDALQLPACKDCKRYVEAGTGTDARLDRGKPYWERDTIWARTGFGTLDPDLARDVLAGKR